tara:strand:- start:243 stop:437 length:195 start_codon:yes stop_codon:yes gene_type:complete
MLRGTPHRRVYIIRKLGHHVKAQNNSFHLINIAAIIMRMQQQQQDNIFPQHDLPEEKNEKNSKF